MKEEGEGGTGERVPRPTVTEHRGRVSASIHLGFRDSDRSVGAVFEVDELALHRRRGLGQKPGAARICRPCVHAALGKAR